jgi:hypothetical protein
VHRESCEWGPDKCEKNLEGVLTQVDALIIEGLTEELLLEIVFIRRIQPLSAHAHEMWLHVRSSDPTWELAEEWTESDLNAQVKRVSGEGAMVNLGNCPTSLRQGVPSTRERVFCHVLKFGLFVGESLIQFCP